MKILISLIFSSFLFTYITPGHPIAIFHGIGDFCSREGLKSIASYIQKRTGQYTECIESGGLFQDFSTSIKHQSEIACEKIKSNPHFQSDFNIITISQGGLIARYIIEKCDMKGKPKTFISIGAPHAGTSKIPRCFSGIVCYALKKIASSLVYYNFAQSGIGPAGYFKDNMNMDTYLNYSNFLADLNNERDIKNEEYKKRFIQLEKLVLIKFKGDTMIFPKETAWFEFTDEKDNVIPLNQSDFYIKDYIGLRKLNEDKKVDFVECEGEHVLMTYEEEEKYLYPYLK